MEGGVSRVICPHLRSEHVWTCPRASGSGAGCGLRRRSSVWQAALCRSLRVCVDLFLGWLYSFFWFFRTFILNLSMKHLPTKDQIDPSVP